jgi:hypothetical protein
MQGDEFRLMQEMHARAAGALRQHMMCSVDATTQRTCCVRPLCTCRGLYKDDDTNGHIDNFACFAKPGEGTLLCFGIAKLPTELKLSMLLLG